jgi:multidrug efflux pump subunit AcrA (membrane-fusion protein)
MESMPVTVRRCLLSLIVLVTTVGPVLAQKVESIRVNKAEISILDERRLSAEIPGLLKFLNPSTEGVIVKKGDVLVQLNDTIIRKQYDLAMIKAESNVEIEFARIALEKAKIDYETQLERQNERKQRTNNKVIPFTESEMRQAKLELDKAIAQLEKTTEDKKVLEMEAAAKESELQQYSVIAPRDGTITMVHVRPGQSVRQGDPILTLTDLSVVRATVSIDYGYGKLVSIGDEVEIVITQPDRISSRSDSQKKTGDDPQRSGVLDDAPGLRDVPAAASPADGDSENETAAPPDAVSPDDKAPAKPRTGEKFLGKVTFIKPQLSAEAKDVELFVDVPNRLDSNGQYALKEGVQVDARVILRR